MFKQAFWNTVIEILDNASSFVSMPFLEISKKISPTTLNFNLCEITGL
ncbi:hypothetical protein M135_1851 [Bacteroides fragilis str. S36L5]|nr:hypothetical protein M067_1594 [Bacteroides fragilis str. J-143-4]EYA91665.1 hypothetical protein M135_1851 [Bacteroides fragilis str. S36L5]